MISQFMCNPREVYPQAVHQVLQIYSISKEHQEMLFWLKEIKIWG